MIQKGTLTTKVNTATSFYEQSNTANLWGLFVNAGYLTIAEVVDIEEKIYTLRIPNREVLSEFKDLTAYHLHTGTEELNNLYQSFIHKDQVLFFESYKNILLANPSYYDLKNENSYLPSRRSSSVLLLGICLYIQHDFEVISNREVGSGRCDIMLKAKKAKLPTYIIEMKYAGKDAFEKDSNCLCELAQNAIQQIRERQYEFHTTGEVIAIGLAHYGKHVEMKWAERLKPT